MSQLDKEAIHLEIVKFVQENLDKDLSTVATDSLFSDCGLDSMAVLDVVFHLEEVLGIRIENIALTRDSTLDDVLSLVEATVQAK